MSGRQICRVSGGGKRVLSGARGGVMGRGQVGGVSRGCEGVGRRREGRRLR